MHPASVSAMKMVTAMELAKEMETATAVGPQL